MKRLKVLIAKPGLDGHDRGAKVVAHALRDAGMEVLYTGLKRTPQEIVGEAVQEDVDVIGLSVLSGAHELLCASVVSELRDAGADDIKVAIGGTIPAPDVPKLLAAGAWAVFPVGTSLPAIITAFEKLAAEGAPHPGPLPKAPHPDPLPRGEGARSDGTLDGEGVTPGAEHGAR